MLGDQPDGPPQIFAVVGSAPMCGAEISRMSVDLSVSIPRPVLLGVALENAAGVMQSVPGTRVCAVKFGRGKRMYPGYRQ
ncbi:hypothetical protein Ssi02_00950 [Sinosporangium siamense]|uniref:Uncharacterized protein n=1 Tax=Sinosporangium siamense TaxID=1367973 RepID=A0A919RCB3_9ACTN|nr:hypothetical protein Ssi02_00950 [Sinosporangium siamense]